MRMLCWSIMVKREQRATEKLLIYWWSTFRPSPMDMRCGQWQRMRSLIQRSFLWRVSLREGEELGHTGGVCPPHQKARCFGLLARMPPTSQGKKYLSAGLWTGLEELEDEAGWRRSEHLWFPRDLRLDKQQIKHKYFHVILFMTLKILSKLHHYWLLFEKLHLNTVVWSSYRSCAQ